MSTFEALLEGSVLKIAQNMYKKPTAIQKEVIPLVVAGHDVVAMSKTGSGKTAAFLFPAIMRLKEHSKITGCRCLIITPTRELAIQTGHYFTKYSQGTNLKVASLIGGEPLPPQFEALTKNPDVIIATPGRLLQIIAETQYSLERVEMLIIDEADLLFEQGLEPQTTPILSLCPEKKQILLFSATVPAVLAEFTRVNLSRAIVVRIDPSKLPKTLSLKFKFTNPYFKPALLLSTVVEYKSSLVFVATRHHAEYLACLLRDSKIKSAAIYGSMDQDERSSSLAGFARGSIRCLIVTDVAARGLDIEGLELVVNYDFPERPKVFLHRAGRAGRAERKGTVISFVTQDELPYFCGAKEALEDEGRPWNLKRVSQTDVQNQVTTVEDALKRNYELTVLKKGMEDGEKMYIKSRKSAKPQWLSAAKELHIEGGGPDNLEERLRDWRPTKGNIFEQNPQYQKQKEIMEQFRKTTEGHIHHDILKKETKTNEAKETKSEKEEIKSETPSEDKTISNETQNEEKPKERKKHVSHKPQKENKPVQSKFFIQYKPEEDNTSSIRSGNASSLLDSVMDMVPDDQQGFLKMKQQQQYYKKKVKTAHERAQRLIASKNATLVKAATAQLTGAQVKGQKYEEWASTSRVHIQPAGEEERVVKGKTRIPNAQKKVKSELKTARQIEREMLIKKKHKLNDAGRHQEARALNAKIFGYENKKKK